MDAPDIDEILAFLTQFQQDTCTLIQKAEGGAGAGFHEEVWDRPEGGGGRSRVLEGGSVIERAGVNFSHVFGEALPPSASARRPHLAGRPFEALGVSVIVHPLNPYAPTSHANLRFFQAASNGESGPVWWFGGGFDLTPYYGFAEDASSWHRAARAACEPFGEDLYPRLKKWCDEYFFLPHRNEQRGIGGLFFDDFDDGGFNNSFSFARAVGSAYLEAYAPILERRQGMTYSDRERQFQLYRRGRYVEFNLVYDRGTLFGLQSRGRAESILVSMPPSVQWRYNWHPEPGSPEAELYETFLQPRDWIGDA